MLGCSGRPPSEHRTVAAHVFRKLEVGAALLQPAVSFELIMKVSNILNQLCKERELLSAAIASLKALLAR